MWIFNELRIMICCVLFLHISRVSDSEQGLPISINYMSQIKIIHQDRTGNH